VHRGDALRNPNFVQLRLAPLPLKHLFWRREAQEAWRHGSSWVQPMVDVEPVAYPEGDDVAVVATERTSPHVCDNDLPQQAPRASTSSLLH